jgi:hypothetical protein
VIKITELACPPSTQFSSEARMPILMVALMALVAFGLIGILLFTAGSLERRKEKKTSGLPAEAKPVR